MTLIDFTAESFSLLAGTSRKRPDATRLITLDKNQFIEVTLLLRRKEPLQTTGTQSIRQMTRGAYAKKHVLLEEDILLVSRFAYQFSLSVCKIEKLQRMVTLSGKIHDFEKAFQVTLSHYRDDKGHVFRGRSGGISLPASLHAVVEGVFGLDERRVASPRIRVAKKQGRYIPHGASPQSFYANELAKIYGFPNDTTGRGERIAIIELGGGYRMEDLRNYFSGLGLSVPEIHSVSVDGGKNNPSTADSEDAEVMLDIEVAGSVAPDAGIVIYFAPNTDKGFLSAISAAIHDTTFHPDVISISWGETENNWTQQSMQAFNELFKTAAALGITVCAAAGDAGSSDGDKDGKVHVDFPASSPYVLACGGTRLTVSNNTIKEEVAWHSADGGSTGGGVSDFFEIPAYQKAAKVPRGLDSGFKGRGIPDLAANADPETGYRILVDGVQMVIGGTSAVAPLIAGLIARINEKQKTPLGWVHPRLYAKGFLYRDITEGDNITTSGRKGYAASEGWDACTGWGVVSGLKSNGLAKRVS